MHEGLPAVISADVAAGQIVEIDHTWTVDKKNLECCPRFQWAPDDSSILATPADTSGRAQQQLLWNPETGDSQSAPWTSTSDPTWQRLSP